MKIDHKLFSDDNNFHKLFSASAALSEMSGCYKWVKGKNKARFKLIEDKWNGSKCRIKSYRFIGTTYEFTVKELY